MSDPVPDLPTAPPAPGDWVAEAACRTPPPGWSRREWVDLFFPHGSQDHLAANSICVQCPVQGDCLDYALRIAEASDHGIWAATSERQRRRIRRDRRRRGQLPPPPSRKSAS